MSKYSPKTKENLQKLVNDNSVNLGDIDTSAITDMSNLFEDSEREDFSGIENWDTSSVKNMADMFCGSKFNQNINDWNVSKVKDMSSMFRDTPFNQPLDNWNVSNVTDMSCMFSCTPFNQSLNGWNVSSVKNMSHMFDSTPFNQSLDKWNVSSVTDMWSMFSNSKFNQNINDWNVSKVTNMWSMFESALFNQPLDKWNVSSVTNMSGMFANTIFNQPLDKWDTSSVESFFGIFENCPIKANPPKWYRKHKKVDGKTIYCPQTKGELVELVDDKSVHLGDIDTSAITDMATLFNGIIREDFSGIEKWDFSNVENMGSMFEGVYFNGNDIDVDMICEKLKVAFIVKVDEDYYIEEVLEKYPSRLQATWELKDRYENGDLDDDNDFFAAIGYEPKEISVKDLEPLVDMDMECADWLLRKGIQKAILFDNTNGLSYGGTIGKIFGVFATRLEAIERYTENEYPDEWWNLTTGEMQSLGYQPRFEVEKFIGKDYMNLAEALRWVEWLKWGWKTYWWVEVYQHDGKIIRIVKKIDGDFDEAEAYKKELPLVEEGNAYILIGDSGKWIDAYGDEDDE